MPGPHRHKVRLVLQSGLDSLYELKLRAVKPFLIKFHDYRGRLEATWFIMRCRSTLLELGLGIGGLLGPVAFPNTPSWLEVTSYTFGGAAALHWCYTQLQTLVRRSPGFEEIWNEQLLSKLPQIRSVLAESGRYGLVEFGAKRPSFVAIDLPCSEWFWRVENDLAISIPNRKIYSAAESGLAAVADIIAWRCSQSFREGKYIFNESKIQICSNLDIDSLRDESRVHLRRTTYLDSLATHEMYPLRTYWPLGKKPTTAQRNERECEAVQLILDGIFRQTDGYQEFVEATGILPLGRSKLSNHFGVNILLFNRKLGFIVQRQGLHSLIDAGELVTTGSGSSDWFRKILGISLPIQNVKPGGSFRKLIVSEALRELQEESRLRLREVDRFNVEIVGYGRRFDRGMKPDFYCFLKIEDDYPDDEAMILRRAHRGKEMLFVDDFVTDLFLFAVIWPPELWSKYSSGSFRDKQSAKKELLELVERWFDDITTGELLDHLHPDCRNVLDEDSLELLRRYRNDSERPQRYWEVLLELLTVLPSSSPALRVTAACVLYRIKNDPEFAKVFQPSKVPRFGPGEGYQAPSINIPSD